MIGGWLKAGAAIAKPLAGAYAARQERKAAAETVRAKAQVAKAQGEAAVQLSDQELLLISKRQEPTTWKDEYALILFTSPVLVLFAGCLVGPWDGGQLIESGEMMIAALDSLPIWYQVLLTSIAASVLSLKIARGLAQ